MKKQPPKSYFTGLRGGFLCSLEFYRTAIIENRKLLYEKRQSASRRQDTALRTSQSRLSQMAKAALSMIESTHKEDWSPLYNRPKATERTIGNHHEDDRKSTQGQQKAAMRTTKSHHEAIKNKLRDGPHRAALFTLYFSLFVPEGTHFSLFTFNFSLPQDNFSLSQA